MSTHENVHADATPKVIAETDVTVEVRYVECDPMNVAHHSVYPVWLEIARTQLLRQRGRAYKEIEAAGIYIVVARLNIRYRRPAFYDDTLRIHVRLLAGGGVKILHDYQLYRNDELLAEAQTTLVCVNKKGELQPIPQGLL